MSTRDRLRRLGPELSLVQAPMAGGVSTPALAGAVAAAGGVGSLGFAYSAADRIADELRRARTLASGGVLNANFFIFKDLASEAFDASAFEAARAALERVCEASGLAPGAIRLPEPPWFPDLSAQLEPVWDLRPQWLSFHFGVPPAWVIERAHELGITVLVTATSLGEARLIAASGSDVIVAQGAEAGGHRGVFDPAADDRASTTRDLLRILRGQVDLPVIAAGGLMDARDMAAMLAEGAAGVQMGTAFLRSPESGASAAHKWLCQEGGERGTEVTVGFSGRPARGIRNRFIEQIQGCPVLPFPLQNTMTAALRQAAVRADDPEHQSLWAGTGYAQAQAVGAGDLVREIGAEWR
jgi:nitronate monooxygenase